MTDQNRIKRLAENAGTARKRPPISFYSQLVDELKFIPDISLVVGPPSPYHNPPIH